MSNNRCIVVVTPLNRRYDPRYVGPFADEDAAKAWLAKQEFDPDTLNEQGFHYGHPEYESTATIETLQQDVAIGSTTLSC